MSSSGKTERYVPGEGDPQTALEHTLRYEFALELCHGRFVVDLACGDGYGSALVAQEADRVLAIDLDVQTIRAASERYGHVPNVEFRPGDAHATELPDASVDCVLAFEMIEHVNDPARVASEIARILRPDGILVISTPNAPENPENLPGANPFHLHAFDERSFDELLSSWFSQRSYFGERVVAASALWPLAADASASDAPVTAPSDRVRRALSELGPTYLVALAHNGATIGESRCLRWSLDRNDDLLRERVQFWRDATAAHAREQEAVERLELAGGEQFDGLIRETGRSAAAAQAEVASLRSSEARLRSELTACEAEGALAREQADYFREEVLALREAYASVVGSASWQVTRPFRRLRGSTRPEQR